MKFCIDIKIRGPGGSIVTPLMDPMTRKLKVFEAENIFGVLEQITPILKEKFPPDNQLNLELIGINIFPEIE
jgi:hypothetical protein